MTTAEEIVLAKLAAVRARHPESLQELELIFDSVFGPPWWAEDMIARAAQDEG